MRKAVELTLLGVLLLAGPQRPAAARTDRHSYALSLLQEGRRRLALGSVDQRRMALSLFEDAAMVASKDPDVLVALGDAYTDARYLHRARTTYEHALALAPDNADVQYGFARILRRDWLDSGWPSDLDSAVARARLATRLRAGFAPALEALSALEVEHGDVPAARAAAESALAAAPDQPLARIAAAELAYRSGELVRADSLFRLGIPGLDSPAAARFDDISPLLPLRDAEARQRLPASERSEAARRFWSVHDPDPITPQNEAQLEYWSRQAHALLLLGDPWGPIWRERTAVYVRYGRRVQVEEALAAGGHNEMPRLDLGEVAETPTPAQLERLAMITDEHGQAAFAPLPPGLQPLRVSARAIRFENARGPRLLAQVETFGTPGEEFTADCVVLDADEHVIARSTRHLSSSACDPAALRSGDFSFDVAPGTYRFAIAVRDTGRRRGVWRAAVEALSPTRDLGMSELAPNCGPPELATAREGVRLNPNPRVRVTGTDPLVAYFELYRLGTEGRNESRFEYKYEVREIGAPGVPWYRQRMEGSAAASTLAFETTQRGVGALRRQFIRVPTSVLPAGRYEVAITVHDLITDQRAREALVFSRLWSPEELSGEAPLPATSE